MPRKTEIVQIGTDDRDKGKRFVLTEMPALKAERWAIRALLALSHSGVDLGPDARTGGMAALAAAGLKALHNLDFAEAQPLLDEMWDCVQIMADPKRPDILRRLQLNEMEGDDIEEISTVWLLRERIFNLHTAFFLAGKR